MHDIASSPRQWLKRAERRYSRWFQKRPLRSTILTFAAAFLTLAVVWVIIAGYSAYMVRAKTNDLTALMDDPDSIELSSELLATAERDVVSLSRNINRLERLTRVPLLDGPIGRIPYAGERFTAARQTLKMGSTLGRAGATAAGIGRDAYDAFDMTGISHDEDNSNDTWLMAVNRHRDEMPGLAEQLREAQLLRTDLDAEFLPGIVERQIGRLDRFMEYVDDLVLMAENYDEFFHAAGGDGTVRYLVLFQNPAELRPAGGFPGTFGVFEFRSGQLVEYEMWDSHIVTSDYVAHRSEKLPQPWPFETYAPQDGMLLHDGTWFADFPRSAELTLQMYDETTWPEVNGLIAVQPQAVSDMIRATGPVEIEVEGEIRQVNESNVYDEVERFRRLRFEGLREGELGDHKDILIDIGEAIMEKFTNSDGTDTVQAVRLLLDSADRRDLQIYVRDSGVQAFLDSQRWSGQLEPDPATPTIALTFTNFVLEKASMAMQPYYDLHLRPNDSGGYDAVLHIALQHTGRHDQDHRYFGFQRWWIDFYLPHDARLIDTSHELMPDPDAPNGGSYAVDLFPEELEHVTLEFELPALERFMIRRQPGQVPPQVNVHMHGCESTWGGYLIKDLYVDLESGCPSIPDPVHEPPQLLMTS